MLRVLFVACCLAFLISITNADELISKNAICIFQGTTLKPGVSGWMSFTTSSPSDNVAVQWRVCGLDPGNHLFHVHDFGNLFSLDGNSVGGHFIGTCNGCRSPPFLSEVGDLSGGNDPAAPRAMVVGADGCTNTSALNFADSVIKLNGPNSIIGRAIVIHGVGNSATARAAWCAIGRNDLGAVEAASGTTVSEMPTIAEATCNLQETQNSNSPIVRGYVDFVVQGASIAVKYFIYGLGQGPTQHLIHVHQTGNIGDAINGANIGPHFIGTCNNCRPSGVLQEVGMLGDGYTPTSVNNTAVSIHI